MGRASGLERAVHDCLAFSGADLRLDRSLEGAHDVARGDRRRIAREDVAATGAALALNEPGLPKAGAELLEIGLGQLLARRDRMQAHRALAVVAREVDHQAHAVLAARGNMESGLWSNSEHFTRYCSPRCH